ncbi:phospholipase D family protein [Pigmentibacter sp. JX0631]|uniref:phospholipase D family nuclease n=1 Tax=Pigmentibacter sp. JX0631 TaxID=2976982 RepID=UPI0024694349|nr:phospholipase D family protein [Pigmentibacter sp. JX0631]WGL60933.1 phospholipase D family protein [Pigmentibacter sp. JX0631]
MSVTKNILILFMLLLSAPKIFAGSFNNSNYEICFTPGENCTELITKNIAKAKKTLLIQAYSFTSAPIAKAIIDAKKRGVEVMIILDKSQFSQKYSSAKFLVNQEIQTWKDDKVAIAHNKVMIIDNFTIITGSFNFTKAAQQKNAENVLVIDDANLAKKYSENWYSRQKVSTKVN